MYKPEKWILKSREYKRITGKRIVAIKSKRKSQFQKMMEILKINHKRIRQISHGEMAWWLEVTGWIRICPMER